MKRLIRLAARLYPRAWRDRYGLEFQALLDETKPGWRDIVDVLEGGVQMQVRRAHPVVVAAAVGIIGASAAGLVAINMADRFVSKGTMNVGPAGTAKPAEVMPKLARQAFDGNTLTASLKGTTSTAASAPRDRRKMSSCTCAATLAFSWCRPASFRCSSRRQTAASRSRWRTS